MMVQVKGYMVDEAALFNQTWSHKVMYNVFWDTQDIIFLGFLKTGTTVNSKRYIKILIKLKARIARTRSEKKKLLLAAQQCQATRESQNV